MLERGPLLAENGLNDKLALSATKRALKQIHLRVWTSLSRFLNRSLFATDRRIEFQRRLIPEFFPRKYRAGSDSDRRSQPSSDSAGRAQQVANIIEELNTFRAGFEIPEDYERFRSKHSKYKIFRLATKHESFKEKLLVIDRRPQLIGLAQEAAALLFRRKLSTIKTDWKRHKPDPFRNPPQKH
jgi:hypothetical protein